MTKFAGNTVKMHDATTVTKGLTSTWALEDGGLVFCEEDLVFELDGWEEADQSQLRLVVETEKKGVGHWIEDGSMPPHPSTEGFTVITCNDYQASLQ